MSEVSGDPNATSPEVAPKPIYSSRFGWGVRIGTYIVYNCNVPLCIIMKIACYP